MKLARACGMFSLDDTPNRPKFVSSQAALRCIASAAVLMLLSNPAPDGKRADLQSCKVIFANYCASTPLLDYIVQIREFLPAHFCDFDFQTCNFFMQKPDDIILNRHHVF